MMLARYQSLPLIHFLLLLLLACHVHSNTTMSVDKKIVLKVNLGGDSVDDFLGEEKVMDMEGFSKTRTKETIQGTDQQEVFQTQIFSRNEDMTIRLPVPDGIYSVTLLFAETYEPACMPGARVFHIAVGTPVSGISKVVDSFDVFSAAGCKVAFGKRFERIPSKEGIVVQLVHKSQHPFLNGFIVEGFPLIKGDGSEFKAIGRISPEQQQMLMDTNDQTAHSFVQQQPVLNQQQPAMMNNEMNTQTMPISQQVQHDAIAGSAQFQINQQQHQPMMVQSQPAFIQH